MKILENNSWTDEYYQLASFIYNEPQRLGLIKKGKGSESIYEGTIANLRTLEVPLNYLFNIVMRLAPQRIKRRILGCFLPVSSPDFGKRIRFSNNFDLFRYHDLSFIRPDSMAYSDSANICLELKARTGTKISLKQTYKYLRFVALWQSESRTRKTPYLLFLTNTDLYTQWHPKERDQIFTGEDKIADLAHYLRMNPPSNPEHLALIEPVLDSLQLGWATWRSIGQVLHDEVILIGQSETTEDREMLENLLGDFVQELSRAGLWREYTSVHSNL